jgi:uncharacterized protein YqgV (UPF0045/DUF77 family)
LQEVQAVFAGCQFSLYPMTDRFIDVILSAVAPLRERGDLRIETDDLSTLVVGAPQAVFDAVQACYLNAARSAGHVVLNATFSRGCPGEPDDALCTPQGPQARAQLADIRAVEPAGLEVAAQFAVYPLGIGGYMDVIATEIDEAKKAGVYARSKHFCTRLGGDGARVFAAMSNAFERAALSAGHIVLTATVSKGSPTAREAGEARHV